MSINDYDPRLEYAARKAWAEHTLPKPYLHLSGEIVGLTNSTVGINDGKTASLIDRRALSLASELILQGASEGQSVELLARGR